MRFSPLILSFLVVFPACSFENDVEKQLLTMEDNLVMATPQEVSEGAALDSSYIVTFKSEVPGNALAFTSFFAEYQSHYEPIAKNFMSDPRIANIQFLTSVDLSKPTNFYDDPGLEAPEELQLAWTSSRLASVIGSVARVDFKDQAGAEALLSEWKKDGRFWFAEPNYQSSVHEGEESTKIVSQEWVTVKDNYEKLINEGGDSFYWLSRTNAVGAYDALSKIAGSYTDQPIVAVMDSGVDVLHPSLEGRIWTNDNGKGTGSCGSDDMYGCNTSIEPQKGVLGDGDVSPFGSGGMGKACPAGPGGSCSRNCCHGTHVAGIIAAKPSKQVAGICPICRIMVLRVVNKTKDNAAGTILDSSIIGALKYVTHFRGNEGLAVRIINASFGKFQRSRAVSVLVRALIDTPRSNQGTLVIAAAGNEDTNKMQYPAAFKDSIAVSNIHIEGPKHESSNFGRWVDVSAPGTRIPSTVPGGGVESKSGTSMAAPVVAGIAGLVLAARPDISISGLRNNIINGANADMVYTNNINRAYLVRLQGETGTMPLLGTGMVDALAAVNQDDKNPPTVAPLNRVDDSCGMIGNKADNPISHWIWLGLLLPVILAVIFQKKIE